MVFYFQPRRCEDGYSLYMGKDKYENEELIRYALPHDVWFHVDALSSAHVYLRLPEGTNIEDIYQEALEDAAQLVKANSIHGNKVNNLDIVFTMASNLKKTAAMEVGQVGFHDEKAVKKIKVEKRSNEIINRLNKTKKELYPDLELEKEAWDREQRSKTKAQIQAQRAAEKKEREEKRREEELRSYKNVMREEDMTTVKEMREKYKTPEEYEEDFM